ncbi:MAG: sigma-70 family RNA polymerase sigma factor [Desulfobacteraceae bacterium]|nr:sigma-70 family RNA polymerase sigma factor [Desulfobacteraceae bacterium]
MPTAPSPPVSDTELIHGCLTGDNHARETFVRRFSRLVYSTIQGAYKSRDAGAGEQDIEDLHNTVFVSFFDRRCRKLRQFEGRNGCRLASWVRMITVRAVLDHLRRNKDPLAEPQRLIPIETTRELVDENQASPWALIEAGERQALIEKGLKRLSSRDQLMIRLHCLEERPLAELAVILKVSEANVHSVKHRAIQRLKEAVAQLTKNPTGTARNL